MSGTGAAPPLAHQRFSIPTLRPPPSAAAVQPNEVHLVWAALLITHVESGAPLDPAHTGSK